MEEFKDGILTIWYPLHPKPEPVDFRVLQEVLPWRSPYFVEKHKGMVRSDDYFIYGMRVELKEWPTKEKLQEVDMEVMKFGVRLGEDLRQIHKIKIIIEELAKANKKVKISA